MKGEVEVPGLDLLLHHLQLLLLHPAPAGKPPQVLQPRARLSKSLTKLRIIHIYGVNDEGGDDKDGGDDDACAVHIVHCMVLSSSSPPPPPPPPPP